MMPLLFLDDIKSEQEQMRITPERLDYLGFLGYGLDDEILDHSVLSKAWERWGGEVFLSLFSRVVHQCAEAGSVASCRRSRAGVLRTFVGKILRIKKAPGNGHTIAS